MNVADILRWFPQTSAVFDRYGFAPLRNPVARLTVARGVTLRQAASMRRVSLPQLVSDLSAAASARAEPDPHR